MGIPIFALVLISAFVLWLRDQTANTDCRFCQKSISRDAVICPYCRSDFRPASEPIPDPVNLKPVSDPLPAPVQEEEEEDDYDYKSPIRKIPSFEDEYAAALRKARKRKGA